MSDLNKYIYTNGRKSVTLSEEIECTKHTISNIKRKKCSPNLVTALKLSILSFGEITLEDLLKKQDRIVLDDWLKKKNLSFKTLVVSKKPH